MSLLKFEGDAFELEPYCVGGVCVLSRPGKVSSVTGTVLGWDDWFFYAGMNDFTTSVGEPSLCDTDRHVRLVYLEGFREVRFEKEWEKS